MDIVGQRLRLKLASIPEVAEPEDSQGGTPVSPAVPTPYFTPELSWFDPASPPADPTPLELALCIAHRAVPRWTRAPPGAPRGLAVPAFTPALGVDLHAPRAWGRVLAMVQDGEPVCARGVGLGLDVPALREESAGAA